MPPNLVQNRRIGPKKEKSCSQTCHPNVLQKRRLPVCLSIPG